VTLFTRGNKRGSFTKQPYITMEGDTVLLIWGAGPMLKVSTKVTSEEKNAR